MSKLRSIDRRLITILLIVFVQMVGASMILPILPIYARREFDMSPTVITMLNTAFFAAQFLAGPLLGRWSDRYGRIPVLIISQIGTAASFLMLALAPGPALLFAARILDGITGGNIIVAQAYVTDITPKEKRTEALGYIFAMFGLGFIVGPAVGGLLVASVGPRLPYVFASAAAILVVLLTWRTLDETVTPEQREANRAFSRSGQGKLNVIFRSDGARILVYIFTIAFVGQFAFGLLQSTYSLYGEEVLFVGYTESQTALGIGLLLAVVGLTQFLSQTFLLRRLLALFDEVWLVIAGNVFRAAGMIIYVIITTPWFGIFSSVTFALGMALAMPPLQSMTTKAVADEMRGGVLGVYQSVISLATIISTFVAGFLYSVQPSVPFWIGGVLSLLAIVPALPLISYQRSRREAELALAQPTSGDAPHQPT